MDIMPILQVGEMTVEVGRVPVGQQRGRQLRAAISCWRARHQPLSLRRARQRASAPCCCCCCPSCWYVCSLLRPRRRASALLLPGASWSTATCRRPSGRTPGPTLAAPAPCAAPALLCSPAPSSARKRKASPAAHTHARPDDGHQADEGERDVDSLVHCRRCWRPAVMKAQAVRSKE